jgi:hypothetical protein
LGMDGLVGAEGWEGEGQVKLVELKLVESRSKVFNTVYLAALRDE